MENQKFYTKIISSKLNGFYIPDFHGEEVCQAVLNDGGILIDHELHQFILELGMVEFIGTKEERVYTLADKDLFRAVEAAIVPQPPSTEERLAALEQLMMGVI